jgi:protein TonB
MNAFVLHDLDDHAGTARWGASAAIIVAAHAALIALTMAWYTHSPPPGVTMPAIMVDMAPASAAPQTQPMDVAPGPEMQQADVSPPEVTPPETVQEPIAPTPPQEKPEVEAPPEQKAEPAPQKPEPAKIVPEPAKPTPVKPKPVRAEAKKPTDALPAPRTSAAPRAERQAPAAAAAASAGASAAAIASYNQLVAAHLQRFKQYPAGSKAAGEQGTSRLSFTLGRGGQVLGSRLAGSSGHSALDAETLAMVRRAQPFPSFPPELRQGSISFTVPVRFWVR